MWLLEGLVIEKLPSSFVVTPCPVFIQNTLAPGIASPSTIFHCSPVLAHIYYRQITGTVLLSYISFFLKLLSRYKN